MNGGKTDIRDFIQLAERVHNVLADGDTAYLLLVFSPFFFEIRQHLIDVFLRYRTLGAREPDAAFQLAATVGLTRAIALDDDERRELLTLERGEPMLTLAAFAPTANGATFFCDARIDNGRVVVFTAGTVHKRRIHPFTRRRERLVEER